MPPPPALYKIVKTILTYCVAILIMIVAIPLMLIAAFQGNLPLSPSDPAPGGNDDAR